MIVQLRWYLRFHEKRNDSTEKKNRDERTNQMDGCTVCAMVAPLSLGVNWDVDGWHARNAGEVHSQHGISNKKGKNVKGYEDARFSLSVQYLCKQNRTESTRTRTFSCSQL